MLYEVITVISELTYILCAEMLANGSVQTTNRLNRYFFIRLNSRGVIGLIEGDFELQ